MAKANVKQDAKTLNTNNDLDIDHNTSEDNIYSCYDSIENAIDIVEEDNDFAKMFYKHFLAGERTVYQKDITESKVFNDEWIHTLESYFPSIDKIVNNPKSNIKYLEEVVVVEKAKKVNAESVKHLASHTQYMNTVTREGDVIPKKILTTFSEPDYATYENRFIKTLIDRLHVFVANRLKIISENADSFSKNHVNLKSDFGINATDVAINIDVVVKKNINNQDEKHNRNILRRLEFLNRLVLSYKGSPLYRALANTPKVNPPIMKTNVILKNPDFNNCYMLWLFLDKYNTLGYDLDVKQRNRRLSKKVEDGYNHLAMISYLAAEANNNKKRDKFDSGDDLVKTATKKTQHNDDDIIARPDALVVEDEAINEYYFNEYKKIFKKSINEFTSTASSKEVGLRQAIRQFNNIANKVFESYFELEEDDDVFTKLVKEPDPQKEYDDAKEKTNIAKIIREVKEVDYNNAIKQEKKIAKQMAKSSNKLVRILEAQALKTSEQEVIDSLNAEIDKYKKSKESAKDKIITLDGKKVRVMNTKIKSNEKIKKINDDLKTNIKDIKKQEKAKSNDRIKKLREEHAKRVNDIIAKEKENHEKALQQAKDKIAKEKQAANLKLKKERLALQKENKIKEDKLKKELLQKEKQLLKDLQAKNKQKLQDLKVKETPKVEEKVDTDVKENTQE